METLTFNQYIAFRSKVGDPINGEREDFYSFLPPMEMSSLVEEWDKWWDRFVQQGDPQDLYETQTDALV